MPSAPSTKAVATPRRTAKAGDAGAAAQQARNRAEPRSRRLDAWMAKAPALTLDDILQLVDGQQKVKPKPVRFRFAPSPTGDLHIGSCMIGMLNYMGAKKMGGE